jgi:hypothetical protein
MAEPIETLVTPPMHLAKGVWGNERTSLPIGESDIRRWVIATFWPAEPPRIYWDADYARTTRYGGIIAPPDFNPFTWPVQRARSGATVPMGRGKTGMNGGQTDTYGVPMRPGDVIRSRTRLRDWEEKVGRLGLTLYVYSEMEWHNQQDEHVRTRISIQIRY